MVELNHFSGIVPNRFVDEIKVSTVREKAKMVLCALHSSNKQGNLPLLFGLRCKTYVSFSFEKEHICRLFSCRKTRHLFDHSCAFTNLEDCEKI